MLPLVAVKGGQPLPAGPLGRVEVAAHVDGGAGGGGGDRLDALVDVRAPAEGGAAGRVEGGDPGAGRPADRGPRPYTLVPAGETLRARTTPLALGFQGRRLPVAASQAASRLRADPSTEVKLPPR